MRKEKKIMGIRKGILGIIFVGITVFLITMQSGYLTDLGISPLASGVGVMTIGDSEPTTIDVTGCDLGTKTTVTLSAVDKYTTQAVGGYHRYKINGAPAVELADKGTFTASPGDKITILWNNETSTGYYSVVGNYEVPCTGAKTFYVDAVNNGTLSSSLKDSDDDTIDGTSNNQSLDAGDVKDVTVKLSGQYQKDFPYGFDAIVEFNKTNMDDVVLSTEGGSVLTSTNVLQSHSPTYSTESSRKAYLVDPIISNADLKLKVTLDADDSTAPGPSGGDVIITLYPRNYFINEDNLGAFEGPSAEDEDSSLTRDGGFTVTVHVD